MPIKGLTKKEYQRDYMAKKRKFEEVVPASYIEGLNRKYKFLPERPRYLELTDGQILDRTSSRHEMNRPQSELDMKRNRAMLVSNEAYFYRSKRKYREEVAKIVVK